ncbi:mitochondrial large subunit ribosomal protein-domain-containing protein [Hypoxylon sp. NC0597]|nr:mitochondrial large subunit ribosomal protein-domain-containing protein [Hypoxylon sp. NC0597]
MLLPRTLRPIVAHPASPSVSLTRLVLPIRTRCLSTTTIQSSEQPNFSEPIPPSSSESESVTSSTTEAEPQKKARLPYFVGRNNLNNLGVYHKSKRGGNLKLTLLKNGDGDLQALKRDIKESLQLNDGDISVNSVTRQIVIRGHKKMQVLNFLHTIGF